MSKLTSTRCLLFGCRGIPTMSSSVSHSSNSVRSVPYRKSRIPVTISMGATFFVASWLIASQWQHYRYSMDESNLQTLNELAACYVASTGKQPDVNLIDLYKSGMTDRRLQPTPLAATIVSIASREWFTILTARKAALSLRKRRVLCRNRYSCFDPGNLLKTVDQTSVAT